MRGKILGTLFVILILLLCFSLMVVLPAGALDTTTLNISQPIYLTC